jgi:uncharacterized iron-regulated protein
MNIKSLIITCCLQILVFTVFGQNMPAYRIYNSKGKKVSYKKMIKKLSKSDIILFGELHNNSIAHWLQYEVTHSLHQKRQLKLGAEMIEADNQDELNDYLSGTISGKGLDTMARLWPNYDTDYAPLVDYAKENNLSFVASNIPRRYARLVHRNGFEILDTLPAYEKAWIAPLPIAFDIELPRYKNILEMMGDHASPRLVMAQAIKDATMANFIDRNWNPGDLFIHYNGAYHSDYYEGILWYLKQINVDRNYMTISTVEQEDISRLSEDNKFKADFIICVDENMTKTY